MNRAGITYAHKIIFFVIGLLFLVIGGAELFYNFNFKMAAFWIFISIMFFLLCFVQRLIENHRINFNLDIVGVLLVAESIILCFVLLLFRTKDSAIISIVSFLAINFILIFIIPNLPVGIKEDVKIYADFDEKFINRNTINAETLANYLPNFNIIEVLKNCWINFCEIQKAWMLLDYDKIKELCTDDLASQYMTQLKTLEISHQKNIMENINLEDITIVNVKESNNIVELTVWIAVNMKDYIVNKGNVIIKGNRKCIHRNMYELVFKYNKISKIVCPNCGNVMENDKIDDCKYCRTKLKVINSNFVLNSKKVLCKQIVQKGQL